MVLPSKSKLVYELPARQSSLPRLFWSPRGLEYHEEYTGNTQISFIPQVAAPLIGTGTTLACGGPGGYITWRRRPFTIDSRLVKGGGCGLGGGEVPSANDARRNISMESACNGWSDTPPSLLVHCEKLIIAHNRNLNFPVERFAIFGCKCPGADLQ